MQMTTLSNPYPNPPPLLRRKILKEEIELRDRDDSEISPWWKIITVVSYFLIVCGGIITSITVGSLLAAFSNRCLFYARITVKGLDEIAASGGRVLDDENIVDESYGALGDCTFSQYWSVASTVFGGVWGILFLQCGRGGASRRGASQAWIIVPPALLVDLVFFIVSCIILGSTTGGLSFFCNHLKAETNDGIVTNLTCKEIMAFNFPGDIYNTDLYLNYTLAQLGSFLTFGGWLTTLFLLIVRCFIPVDFVVHGRRLYEIGKSGTEGRKNLISKKRRQIFARSRGSALDEENLSSNSTSIEIIETVESSPIATTSFMIPTKATVHDEKKFL